MCGIVTTNDKRYYSYLLSNAKIKHILNQQTIAKGYEHDTQNIA